MRRRAHPVHIRDLDWYKYMRRYVWDDETTPYLVPVPRLHRRQADNEIMLYSLFVCLLFGAVALISTTEAAPYGRSFSASLYGFLTFCAAVILWVTKHPMAAMGVMAAPLGLVVYALAALVRPEVALLDRIVLVALALVWSRYAFRVLAITRLYPDLPEPPPPDVAPPRS